MALGRPNDLVFTLFGEYLLHPPKPVWVGSLLRLLEPLGLSDSAARTALSRMSRKGWFTTERVGRRSYYALTDRGRKLLEEGEERIYDPPRGLPWDGRWLMVTYSVPEEERKLRDRLRDQLLWLGFGSLGNGLWISPHAVEGRVREAAEDLDSSEYLEIFRADHLGFSDPTDLVDQCWDLARINAGYEDFIARHVADFLQWREALEKCDEVDPEEAYLERFRLVHEYREFPFVDPCLPDELLPEDWAGECAEVFFRVYRDLLEEPAGRHVASVVEALPATGAERAEHAHASEEG